MFRCTCSLGRKKSPGTRNLGIASGRSLVLLRHAGAAPWCLPLDAIDSVHRKSDRHLPLPVGKVTTTMSDPSDYYLKRKTRFLMEFDLVANSARSVLEKYF